MHRSVATLACLGALLPALAHPAPPARAAAAVPQLLNLFAYRAQLLPLDSAAGMGDGIVIGRAKGVAVAYVNGQVLALPGKAGYTAVQPTSISSNGYIVGYAHSANDDRGLFWASYANAPLDMGGLGAITHPRSVNAQGVAVGEYYPNSIYDLPSAFAWSPGGGIRPIAPPNSNQSQAFDISDSGYVAGFAWYGTQQAVTRWYPGSLQAGTVAYGSFAWRALEDGTVFGYTTAWDLANRAYNIAPNSISLVYGISGAGRKVGTNIFATPRRGWTVPPGGSTAQLLPVPANVVDTYATAVDGCGTILGSVTYADGSTQALLWSKLLCDSSPVLAAR